MGALLSVCGLGQLACCATSTMCSCLSCITPAIGPRVMNSFILFLVTIVGWIMTLPNVSEWLRSKVPFCWTKQSLYPFELLGKESPPHTATICDQLTGHLAVYRLMFATFLFFVAFAIIMVRVRGSRDPRVALHRGFWFIKFILLVGAVVGAFYIPAESSFGSVWQYFGFVGSFIYLLIQVCFLIIFADDWANEWVSRMESDDSGNCSYCALLSVTLLNYVLSVVGVILFYVYYGGQGCGLHNFLISVNLIFWVLLSVVSILPSIQEANPRSGLLQASIMALYLTYLTWSALNSSPHAQCKPTIWAGANSNDNSMDLQSFVSLLICFGCVVYSSLRLSSNEGIQRITGASAPGTDDEAAIGTRTPLVGGNSTFEYLMNMTLDPGSVISFDPIGGAGEEESEEFSNWPYFYWILALGTLYLMMTLTNWFTPSESYKHFGESASSLWIKMVSSWFSGLIYLWTLIAPILLGEYRDFS